MKLILSFILTATIALNAVAQLKLPSVISDNMVLQQNIKVPIWGWAVPSAAVTVKFLEQSKTTLADVEGCWKIYLNPVPANDKPQLMSIESGLNSITLTNILVGEVWLCSGQSNMQWPMCRLNDPEKKLAGVNDPKIRFIGINRNNFKPYECDDCKGNWQECSTESARNLTAVGYYFARSLREKLNVPVGLIEADYGGTRIEAWTSANVLNRWPDLWEELADLAKYKNNKKFNLAKKQEKEKWLAELKKFDKGFSENWMIPNVNSSVWKKIQLPATWNSSELKNFKGSVWYRKKINIPPEWKNKKLVVEPGAIDQYDITWLNGREIGMIQVVNAGRHPRHYEIGKSGYNAGENTIVICDYNKNGVGGMIGPKEAMRFFPEGEPEKAISLAGEWFYRKGYTGTELPELPMIFSLHPNTLSVLYNSMIAPVIPYAIRGAIWYQGESNRGIPCKYRKMLPDMIKNWRDDWDQGNFPFYYVQIAPFNYNGGVNSALLREAQLLSLKTPNTGMAVTMDIANIKDIHPRNKKDVGYRLALWALAKDYGFTNMVFSGPLYKNMKINDNKIIVSFDYNVGLKTRDGKPLSHFEIAGEDKKFFPAVAEINNDQIIVSCDKIKNPVAVRYGWSDIAEPNLCNNANLPASSFRTDDWE